MEERKYIVNALFRYPQRKAPAVREERLILEEDLGIKGDCHADGGKRQISLMTVQEKEWMEKQEIKGFCFRKYKENILLDGGYLRQCGPGNLLKFDEAVLELTDSMKHCHSELCELAAEGKCILAGSSRFAQVKKSGIIQQGMDVIHILKER